MEHIFLKKAKEMLEKRRKRAHLRQAVTAMMVLVAFSTSYLLMMPAATMEQRAPICGIEAHEHDDSCYETLLMCNDVSDPGHSHNDTCNGLICGEEEYEAHTHSDACKSLTCGLGETAGHSHGDACYAEQIICGQEACDAHSHGDSCWSVTCSEKEDAGHSHSDNCYGTACGLSESAGHNHGDACYTTSRELTCGESESTGHSHGDSCYGEDGSLVCGESESSGHSHGDACYTTSRDLTCGESESVGHSHNDACNGLICGEEEYEAHTHSDTCKSLTCGLSESAGHSHNDACYAKQIICGQEACDAHSHGDFCWSVTCSEKEGAGHSHNEGCNGLTCGQEEREAVESDHTHGPECYVTRLACTKTVHAHDDSCYAAEEPGIGENGDSTAQQPPVDDFPVEEPLPGEPLPGEPLPEIPHEPMEIILSDEALYQILNPNYDLLEQLDLPEEPDYSDSLVVDQTVSMDENGVYTLTLEAFAKGELDPTCVVRPVDLVLVLDQSADLYVPVMGEAELDITADDTAMTAEEMEEAAQTWGLINRETFLWLEEDVMVQNKALLKGYFLAQSAGAEDSTGEWYLVQYLPNEEWQLTSLSDEEDSITCESIDELPDHIRRFYVSCLGKRHNEIMALAESLALSGADHRMAIVGYAGAETEGTALLTGEYVGYAELIDEEAEDIWGEALIPVVNKYDEVSEQLIEAMNNISCGHDGSSLAAGLSMAEQILAADDLADTQRDRMVVLMANSQPDQDLSGYEDPQWAVMDAINIAYNIKNSCDADMYTISSDLEEEIAAYISSEWPKAIAEFAAEDEETTEPELVINAGDEAEDEFAAFCDNHEERMDAILALGQQILDNRVELNETTVLSAAIADYFQLILSDIDESEAPQIKVFTADYLGDNTFSDEWVEFTEAQVELVASEEDRVQSVNVSNFNFYGEILSETDELSGVAAGGRKLILQVPVEVREGFWGGNNVPVASEDTGIYSGTSNVKQFPVPEVNVEMILNLEANIATMFYGQTVGIDDLVETLSVGGVEVMVDSSGAFIPQSDWMDDYAELTWVEKPEKIIATKDSNGYAISVNLSPLCDGEDALGAPVGMGNVTTEDFVDETPVLLEEGQEAVELPALFTSVRAEETIVGVNANAVASVQVLAPVITFRDIVISLGNQPDFSTTVHNPVKNIKWVSADGGISVSDGSNTPDLSFVYSPMRQEDVYLMDTPMNVTVLHGSNDITDIVTFTANSCDFNLHDEDEFIDVHERFTETGEDLPEFWVHVQSGIELPNTGGIGTKVFYGVGGVLMVGAAILLVTKKRMADNEDDEDDDDNL